MRLNRLKTGSVWLSLPLHLIWIKNLPFLDWPWWQCWYKVWYSPEHPIWGKFSQFPWVEPGDCPGCGLTRAILALLEGNVSRAVQFHPLILIYASLFGLLWLLGVIYLVWPLIKKCRFFAKIDE